MKQLTCEMCGSTDLIKEGGFFACQTCGTKYSVEEAKKMMIEGTVDVTGSTVKVDNSAFVEKYLTNARRAYGKEDWEEVEKYYNLVEQNAPTNMEAVFFSAYGKAMLAMTDSDYFKREQKFKVLVKSISIINDCFEETNEDKEAVLNNIANAIIKMNSVTFVFNPSIGIGTGSRNWQLGLLKQVSDGFLHELREIYEKHPEEYIGRLINFFAPKPKTKAKTEDKNIFSLIFSIIAMYISIIGVVSFGVCGIGGIVFSIISLSKANRTNKFKVISLVALIVSIFFTVISFVVSPLVFDI